MVSNRLLYLFAVADTRGRKAREMSQPEEQVHLWKSLAEERACFDEPYAFANDQARFLFYRDKLTSLQYRPYENYSCTVTLMSGLPGAAWRRQRHMAGASPSTASGSFLGCGARGPRYGSHG